jgi:RNA polymerase sigma-70 factor (ECF subfamily)
MAAANGSFPSNGAAEAHARDERAFTLMWERHYELIRRYLLRRCPPEQTEDLAQETFLRVWESRQRPLDDVVPLSDVVLAAEHPERQLTASLHYDCVQEAVRNLSPRRRAVFELRWLGGRSHREIAEQLEITVKTVENHLNAAYRELRDRFPEESVAGNGHAREVSG